MIDGHVHLFHPNVIGNVKKKEELVEKIGLMTQGVENRVGRPPLEAALKKAGIGGGLVLPTAGKNSVGAVNDRSYKAVEDSELLQTAGTLHPQYPDNEAELLKLMSRNIKGIKLCSFSQGFSLGDPATWDLFDLIERFNKNQQAGFFVVLDTLYSASRYFGNSPEYNTTPESLANIVKAFPQIDFIAAHMGGLDAPFEEIRKHLIPAENLYLDTSNAAHVLDQKAYVFLLKAHGPGHIIFGTDWPWFTHLPEIDLQKRLLEQAGYVMQDVEKVFSTNMMRLLQIPGP